MITTFRALLETAMTNGGRDQAPNEEDQAYFFTILKALATCPQNEWDSLGLACPTAHKWYELAADAFNHGKEMPIPDGFYSAKAVPPLATISAPVPPVKTAKAKAEAEVPAKAKEEPRKEREKRNKNAGILDAIRKIVIVNPTLNAKQVHEQLTKNGFPNASTAIVAVNVGDIKRVVALVKEMGYWQERKEVNV